jgi:hypothetical protein
LLEELGSSSLCFFHSHRGHHKVLGGVWGSSRAQYCRMGMNLTLHPNRIRRENRSVWKENLSVNVLGGGEMLRASRRTTVSQILTMLLWKAQTSTVWFPEMILYTKNLCVKNPEICFPKNAITRVRPDPPGDPDPGRVDMTGGPGQNS